MARPTKYADMSPNQVNTSENSNKNGPNRETPCNRTANVNGNAIRTNALELIPAAGNDSTIGRRVASVKTISPIKKIKNTSATDGVEITNREITRCRVSPLPSECASSIAARYCEKTINTAQLAVQNR